MRYVEDYTFEESIGDAIMRIEALNSYEKT